MMASPRKPPRRIGGANFSSPQRHPRAAGTAAPPKEGAAAFADASSPPGRGKLRQGGNPAAATVSGITSARGQRLGGTEGGAGERCRSEDGRSIVSTACTERAEQYIQRLAGQGRTAPANAPLEWALVQELDAVDSISKENERRRAAKAKRLENQDFLRQQQASQMRVKDECKQVWRDWREELEDDAEKFKKEEDEKKANKLEVRRRFDDDRRRQLEANNQFRRVKDEADAKESRDMLQAAQQAKAKEDEREERRRLKERTAAMKMAEEATSARVRKEKMRHDEHDNDIKMAKEQQELLEKQDRDRAAFLQKLRDKQSSLLAAYEAGVGNELEKRQREDEERAQRQQRIVADKERHQLEAKENRLREMKEAGKAAVSQQLEDQGRHRKMLQDEETLFVERLRKETATADEVERLKQEKKRQAVEANAAYVRNQIRERSHIEPSQVQRDRMNEVERQINRDKLERAKDSQRPDGLQLLLKKKKMEYRSANSAR